MTVDTPDVPATAGSTGMPDDPAAELRAVLAEALDESPAALADDEDLVEVGLDSVTIMGIAARWRARGVAVEFAELAREPTLRAWTALLRERAGRPAAPPDLLWADPREPFELTPMQHASWVGRRPGLPFGDVGAHFYHEFDTEHGTAVDPERLREAVAALAARHPALRLQTDDEGRRRVVDGLAPAPVVLDLREATSVEAQEALARRREELSHRGLDPAQGRVVEIGLTLLPDGRTRLHVDLDMLVADARSFRLLLDDLARLYAGEAPAPVGVDVATYLATLATHRAPARERARAWWDQRLPDLPGAPALPVVPEPPGTAPRVSRRTLALDAGSAGRFTARARARGITPAMAAATVFAEVVAAWSAEPRFLLNLPLFDREPYHPGVEHLVGDFTSSLLLEIDAGAAVPFAQRAAAVQQRFRRDVEHAAYGGVEVLRDLARRAGRPVLAPVVYTSALDVGDLYSPQFRRCLGSPVWTVSQVPQVWLDAQLSERDGGLFVNWDARESVFPPGVLDALFAAYRTLLTALADGAPETWDAPADPAAAARPRGPLLLPGPPGTGPGARVVDAAGRERPPWVPGEVLDGGVPAGLRAYRGPDDALHPVETGGVTEAAELLAEHPDVESAEVEGAAVRVVPRVPAPDPREPDEPGDDAALATLADELAENLLARLVATLPGLETAPLPAGALADRGGIAPEHRPRHAAWLAWLAERGVLARDADGAYRPGPRIDEASGLGRYARLAAAARETPLAGAVDGLPERLAVLPAELRGERTPPRAPRPVPPDGATGDALRAAAERLTGPDAAMAGPGEGERDGLDVVDAVLVALDGDPAHADLTGALAQVAPGGLVLAAGPPDPLSRTQPPPDPALDRRWIVGGRAWRARWRPVGDGPDVAGWRRVLRAALPRELRATTLRIGAGAAPRGATEQQVAAVWGALLDVTPARTDDFFSLGGDSLVATRAVARLRAAGFGDADIATLFSRPVLADFAATLTLGAGRSAPAVVPDPARRYEPFGPTEVQRAYWLGRTDAFALGGVGCHFYREYDVVDLDVERLEESLARLVARHDMLRVVFDATGDQRVLPEVARPVVPVVVVGPDDEAEAHEALRARMSHQVLDPTTGPPFDVRVVRCGRRSRVGISLDNLALDALSVVRFHAELARGYRAAGHGAPDDEPPAPGLTFRDYVVGRRPDPERVAAAREHWAERRPALPPAPALPLALDPAQVVRPRFVRRCARLSPEERTGLAAAAASAGVTLSATLLAAFSEVLGIWSGREDLTVTVTLFDRDEVHPDVDRVLGDFTSLMLVAYEPGGAPTWRERVRRLSDRLSADLEHREVSAIEVLRDLARDGVEGGAPVVFTSALGIAAGLADEAGEPFTDQVFGLSQTPQVHLDHQVLESDGQVELVWDAVEELYPEGLLDAMFAAYRALLAHLASASWDAPVPDLRPADQRAARDHVNDTAAPSAATLLHEEFFARAAADPHAPAVLDGSGDGAGDVDTPVLHRGELADAALRVASLLAAHGVGEGDLVGITLPKGPAQVVAAYGVLAAGAGYVPVGVEQPPARRDRIHERAGVAVVLTDTERAATPWPAGRVALDLADADRYAPRAAPARPDPDTLAYVIFTSGSTGEPKGVEITHRAAANTCEDVNARFGVGPGDRVLAVSALDFDLSVYDVFGVLGAGGSLVTVAESQRRDAGRWATLAAHHGVTLWNTVPLLLDMLLTVAEESREERMRPAALRVALVSGDWVGLDLADRLHAAVPGARLVALGGATEASIWSNSFEVDVVDPAWTSIPYGQPLRNQRYRVVDDAGRDCPDWVPGELWIGGAGVARGYRNAPELTARSFVLDAGARWYRTGDRGRYRPGGLLEFLGRVDHQVKVRGHRIELGEVEAALASHPRVERAVAVVVGEGTGRRLAAAVTGSGVDPADLVTWAAARLPAAMVPDRVAALDGIPLSANGKVDRGRVRALLATVPTGDAPADPPRPGAEETLAELWRELLDDPGPVGRHDGFFARGGDSVSAMRFLELVRRDLGVTLDVADFFRAPTLAATAESVTAARAVGIEEGVL